MRLRRLRQLVAAGLLAVGVSSTVGLAYWSSGGEGSAAAHLAGFSAPTISGATPGAGTVELTWSAVTPPGSGAVSYFVSRDGGAPGGGCPRSGAQSAVTGCTDTGVTVGAHEYTVTAVWRSWTATSSTRAVTVTVGAATHFQLEASNTAPTAGDAINLTITAKDASNNTVTPYSGPHGLMFEGALEAPTGAKAVVLDRLGIERKFGETTEITFTEGKAVVSSSKNGVMRLYRSEEAHIKVTEGSITNGAGLAVTVKVAVTKRFSVATPLEQTAGAAFNVALTATDEWGNKTASYAGSKTLLWSGPSNSPSGQAASYPSTATTVTFTAGEGTATAITLYDAQNATLKAKEGSAVEGTTAAFTVKAAATTKRFTVAKPIEQTAGAAFNVALTATDEWGNKTASYAGSKTLLWSGPSNSPSGQAASYPSTATTVTFTAGEGTATAITLYDAQSATLKAKEGATVEGTTAAFTVRAGAATRLAFTTSPSTPTAEGTVFTTQPKVTIQDTWLNPAATNTSGVTLTPSGGTLTCTANPQSAAAGLAAFAGCKMTKTGTYTLTATDGTLAAASSSSFVIS